MFESVYPVSSEPKGRRRLAQSELISLLLHVVAVIALLTIRFGNESVLDKITEHVTLLSPDLHRNKPTTIPKPPPQVKLRVFQPPVAVALPRPAPRAIDPPVQLEAAPPKPQLLAEVPRITAPPPPLRTDYLGEVRPSKTVPERKAALQITGFTGTKFAAPDTVQHAVSNAGFGETKLSTDGPHGKVSDAGFSGVSTGTGTNPNASRLQASGPGGFGGASLAGSGPARNTPVQKGGFGDTAVAAAVRPSAAAPASSTTLPVEIISKPRPAYTDDARRSKIEGEVLLEVLFSASGEVRVLRVVQGLGHGLDETAVSAAKAIQFRPARSGGTPIDSTAIVRIVFQLAE